MSLIGKFMASACFAIVYVYTAELFPTMIRNTAIGSCSTVARVGGICALLVSLVRTKLQKRFGTIHKGRPHRGGRGSKNWLMCPVKN